MNNNCLSGSNNIYYNFPPNMEDGRNFTNYNSASTINQNLNTNNLTSNKYRQYLINNTDIIISQNQKASCDECGYCQYPKRLPCKPYIFSSCSDKSVPMGYETSDLKNKYLQKCELESRKIAPVINANQILKTK
tara:strand:+ start:530 stop:931 length:402 start_codon:yes stop_codon:yes gene_type:complete